MKAKVSTVFALAVVLGACQQGPSAEQMAKEGREPLSGEEIRNTIAGNTTYERGRGSGGSYEFAAYYMEGGKARGRAWWSGGDATGLGNWRIDGNMFCEAWNRANWGDGEESCYKVYKDGDKLHYIAVSGPGDNDTVTVKNGNPYEL